MISLDILSRGRWVNILGKLRSKSLLQLFLASSVKVSMALSSFVIFYLTAKLMSASLYGQFAYGFSLATFIGGIATLGLHVGVFRWWSEIQNNDGEIQAEVMLLEGVVGSLAGGVVIGVLTYLFLNLFHVGDLSIFAACLMIPIYTLSEYLSSALRSKGKVGLSLLPRDLYWRLLLCIVFGILWIFKFKINAFDAINIMSVSLVPFVVYQFIALDVGKHASALGNISKLSIYPVRVRQSLSLFASTSLGLATRYFDILLLGIFVQPAAVGAYFVAVRIANLMNIVQLSSNTISGPLIADAYFSGDKHLLSRAVRDIVVPTTLITVMGFLVVCPLSPFILGVFNKDFASSWSELLILGSGVTISCALGPTGYIMQMTGFEHEYLKMSLISGFLTLLVLFIFVYFAGSLGAAIGSSIGMVAIKVWNRQFILKNLGIEPSILILLDRNLVKEGCQ
jgi:O-antigen/teichoic acid export membrane protein